MHKSLPSTIELLRCLPAISPVQGSSSRSSSAGASKIMDRIYSSFDEGRMTGGFFAADDVSDISSASPLVVFYVANLERAAAEVERMETVLPARLLAI